MARFKRLQVLNTMMEQGLIAIFYQPDVQTAQKIVQACADGGARLLELTNRGDFAVETFTALEKYCRERLPDVILGVGSIVDTPSAAMFIAQGANFVVGPILSAEVARLCNRRKIPYIPGCGTASEISQAEELGCEIVKIFPAGQLGGPAFVKAVLGPMSWSSLMPTGGVECTEESLGAWFSAGVACVGIGSALISDALIKAGDYPGISKQVKATLAMIRRVRQKGNNP